MVIRLAEKITRDSIVDGPGLRTVIWTQGCRHNCKGCHNPCTHNFDGGFKIDTRKVISDLKELRLQKGITFSGGDPFEQPEACYEIAVEAKKLGLDIWCYTGYDFERLASSPEDGIKRFLNEIDVLIDRPFELRNKDLNLRFRGSTNQRIIDVKNSINENKTVIIEEYY